LEQTLFSRIAAVEGVFQSLGIRFSDTEDRRSSRLHDHGGEIRGSGIVLSKSEFEAQ
jgi:hypothetical protein